MSIWMSGKGIPDREQIKRIAADCGVDPGWLDYGTTPDEGTPVDRDEAVRKRS